MISAAKEQAIRALAYKLWEEEGRPEGCAETHWLRAVSQLNVPDVTPSAQSASRKKKNQR